MSQSNPMHHGTPLNGKEVVEVPEAITEIQNMDGFAQLIMAWHRAMLHDAKNLLNVPDGSPMIFEENDGDGGKEIILTGDALNAFRAGVVATIAMFTKLPFEAIEEDVAVAADPVNEPG